MTAELFNRYIWLIDTIYGAGRISLARYGNGGFVARMAARAVCKGGRKYGKNV